MSFAASGEVGADRGTVGHLVDQWAAGSGPGLDDVVATVRSWVHQACPDVTHTPTQGQARWPSLDLGIR